MEGESGRSDITEAGWNSFKNSVLKCHCKIKKTQWTMCIFVLIKIIDDCCQTCFIKLLWMEPHYSGLGCDGQSVISKWGQQSWSGLQRSGGMWMTRETHIPAQKEVERRRYSKMRKTWHVFLLCRRTQKKKGWKERERDYEVLENIKSTCEECEESTLIKRKKCFFL